MIAKSVSIKDELPALFVFFSLAASAWSLLVNRANDLRDDALEGIGI
ncbi:MAG TPA: hypothetical protein VK937_09360 [Candidatus Limnocylindria bacterium]|jgi:hypothetical protein|nr:hypothetical protein [Candidatus Limnocylindria bacterium]